MDTTGNESGTLRIGSQMTPFGNVQNNTLDEVTPNVTLKDASLLDHNADDVISLAITSTSNSFYFADSVLTVQEATAAVPEPMSIALIGMGLFGIGAMRGRRKHWIGERL